MSGSVGGIVTPAPRIGTSLSIAASAFDKPNRSAALATCGLVNFICPSSAPTTNTGELPPIFSWMYFQLHPFSRLMSRIFSVRSARVMDVSLACKRGICDNWCPLLDEARPGRRCRICYDRAAHLPAVRRVAWPGPGRGDLRRPRPHHRHVTAIVVGVGHFIGEIFAAAHQKIDDVVAHPIVERMAVHVVALGFLGSEFSTISASTAFGPLVISTTRSAR